MSTFLAELMGTAVLITLGSGVCANVSLARTKGFDSGWIVITAGWGLAVVVAVYAVDAFSGAHLNPAITLGLASIGRFPWMEVPFYILAQVMGAFIGATIVWLLYLPHWAETDDAAAILGSFCTGPAIPAPVSNLAAEVIATGVFVLSVLAVRSPTNLIAGSGLNQGLGPLLVGLIVFAIGLSLGGPTGYAINPARDFGPRLAHALLPIKGKGSSQWHYSWIPIIGPVAGGILGAVIYWAFWTASTK